MKSSIICEKNLRQANSADGTSDPMDEIAESAVRMVPDNDPFHPHRFRFFSELIEPGSVKSLS